MTIDNRYFPTVCDSVNDTIQNIVADKKYMQK